MRITIDLSDCNAPERGMLTFDDASVAVSHMHYRMQFDPMAGVILTLRAAAEFLGKYYEELEELPFHLVREIDPIDDGETENCGALNFTSVEPRDIDTIHDGLPCGAEIREFVRQYECWQLWAK
ncbi:MAG TPA: hypothetical protein VM056_01620 [Terriglobales bacterium]|nr:hypothetical protein [Terriglobales bacterium]